MSEQITRTVSRALAGNRDTGPRWTVTGVDPRGESFTISTPYRDRSAAADFASEVRANGGTAKVVRVR